MAEDNNQKFKYHMVQGRRTSPQEQNSSAAQPSISGRTGIPAAQTSRTEPVPTMDAAAPQSSLPPSDATAQAPTSSADTRQTSFGSSPQEQAAAGSGPRSDWRGARNISPEERERLESNRQSGRVRSEIQRAQELRNRRGQARQQANEKNATSEERSSSERFQRRDRRTNIRAIGALKRNAGQIRENMSFFGDIPFVIALILAILNDIIDLIQVVPILALATSVLSFCFGVLIWIILGFGMAKDLLLRRASWSSLVLERSVIILGGTAVEIIPIISLFPTYTGIVLLMYWRTVRARIRMSQKKSTSPSSVGERRSKYRPAYS